MAQAQARYPWFPAEGVRRLLRAYGTRIDMVLGDAACLDDLGEHIGGDLYACELEYLAAHEFARTSDDVLWRRSKLGLHLDEDANASIARWFAAKFEQTA